MGVELSAVGSLDLDVFGDVGLRGGRADELGGKALSEVLREALDGHVGGDVLMLERWWRYYRNESRVGAALASDVSSGRPRRLAQEEGLPARLGGGGAQGALRDDRAPSPEVVIENDIRWRIDSMVDLVFGKPVRIVSLAEDAALAREIEARLEELWEESGGLQLMQDAALLGSVHGHVDFMLRDNLHGGSQNAGLRVELVEATRGVAVLSAGDYREIVAYAVLGAGGDGQLELLELWSDSWWQRFAGGVVVEEGVNPFGVVPVGHVQNQSQPFAYAGLSDVEPLIPLQDELNTRLSDRAHRVTMQSFNMYLAKGIDSFGDVRVGPGQVWTTDNPDASVSAFGGDGSSPSEDQHIEQIRGALDKASGVSPVVLGVVRERLGHLSSANALRLTMMGLLAKAERKRHAYGQGILKICRLALEAMNRSGALVTGVEDHRLRLDWADVLPISEEEVVRVAWAKGELGVSADEVLREIGDVRVDRGVV